MSERVEFNEIPANIRIPGVYAEIDKSNASNMLPQELQKILIIGQKLGTGRIGALNPKPVFDTAEAALYFGYGSPCHLMVAAALKAYPYLDITVLALNDADAGVAAVGAFTLAGVATQAGVLTVYIGSQKIEIAVAKDDAAAAVAAALNAEIGNYKALPLTAAIDGVDAAKINLTSRNKGTCGNGIHLGTLRVSKWGSLTPVIGGSPASEDGPVTNVPGITLTRTQMTGGDGNPDIQDALDIAAGKRYNIIVSQFANQEALVALRDHLSFVSNALEQRPGIGVCGITGTVSGATTLAGQINDMRVQIAWLRYTGVTVRQSVSYEIAAAKAAQIAFTQSVRIGMPEDDLELKGIAIPNVRDRLSAAEKQAALYNGLAYLYVGTGERLLIGRSISTYMTDVNGAPDPAFLDIGTIISADYAREAWVNDIKLKFQRKKKSKRVKEMLRTAIIAKAYQLEEAEILQDIDKWKDGIIVSDNLEDATRLDVEVPTAIVPGLHIIGLKLKIMVY